MTTDSKALILMYHRIAEEMCDPWSLCVTPTHFQEQLKVVKELVRPLSLKQLISEMDEKKIEQKSVVITFDDGYADNLQNAKPLLEKLDIAATIFIVSSAVNDTREFWSDELERLFLQPGKLPDYFQMCINNRNVECNLGSASDYLPEDFERFRKWYPFHDAPTPRHRLFIELWKELRPLSIRERRRFLDEMWSWSGNDSFTRPTHRPLSEDELRELARGEIFEIAAHTVSHPQLSALSAEEQRAEIVGSRSQLEDLTGQSVISFAYPYGWHGDFSEETVSILQESGYSAACTTIQGVVLEDSNRYTLPRLPVENWNGEEFRRKLQSWFTDKTFAE